MSSAMNTNVFNNLTEAFAAMSTGPKMSQTTNGDTNYAEMGQEFKDCLLELDHGMISSPEEHKAGELNQETKISLDFAFNKCIDMIKMMTDEDMKVESYHIMFRYMLYIRSVRASGKKSKLLFYHIYSNMLREFPKSCMALLELVTEYGYFGDIDRIMQHIDYDDKCVEAALDIYYKHLNADCIVLFGKPINKITNDIAKEINTKLKPMTNDMIKEFTKGKHLSLAAKWMASEKKKFNDTRDMFITKVFYPKYDLDRVSSDSAVRQKAQLRKNYYQMTFRNILSALRQCLRVPEVNMCETNPEHRTWADIDHATAPAGFTTKNRKALLNEELKGNDSRHPDSEDRIQCRENLLEVISQGKLKSVADDLMKLATIIGKGNSSASERMLISSKWNAIIADLKQKVDTHCDMMKAEVLAKGEAYLDPRCMIPAVDRSGSMSSAGVDMIAIALGIVAANLSTMPGCLMTYSDRPQVFKLDLSKDVFEHFRVIMSGPGDLNTNIDAMYRELRNLMVMSNTKETDFALLILSDCQFDAQVHMDGYHNYNNANSFNTYFQQTFIKRMEAHFKEKGYNLPRTIFWNLNGRVPGFPVTGSMPGTQMVSGFSQSLMTQVFTGDYKYEVQTDGSVKVNIDPWTSFHKALMHKSFNPVQNILSKVGEGCLTDLPPPLVDAE